MTYEYEGNFKNDAFEGQGTLINKFVGNFKKDGEMVLSIMMKVENLYLKGSLQPVQPHDRQVRIMMMENLLKETWKLKVILNMSEASFH